MEFLISFGRYDGTGSISGRFFRHPQEKKGSFHHKYIECGEFEGDCAAELYIENISFGIETNIVLRIFGYVSMANIPAICPANENTYPSKRILLIVINGDCGTNLNPDE